MNNFIQQSHLYTHSAYSSALAEALGADCEVVDIYAVPDSTKIFDNCIDEKFSSYSKGDSTQHQFIFVAVPIDEVNFPLGCKTTYRAYSQTEVTEIYHADNLHYPTVNLIPFSLKVPSHPQADPINGIPEG